jgi:hypothetical protein
VQLAQTADSINRANRLLIAGVAVAGAGLVAVTPVAPTLPHVRHIAVQLTAGEQDWAQVFTTAEDNLTSLESEAATANSDLSSALSTELSGFGTQISSALTGAETGFENAFYGGWYGSDDGYVFGLFGGTVTDTANGVSETGSTLQEIATALDQGNLFDAFSYFDTWSLEFADHTLRYLVEPFLSVTSHGATTESLAAELLQTFTNVYEEFGTYTELKNFSDALLSPPLGAAFGLFGDLDGIASDLSSGNIDQALTDIGNLPSDLTGDVLNGFVDPYSNGEPFAGLLASGGILDQLLVTFPEQLATALGESTAPESAAAVTSALPDLLSGLL